MSLEFGLLIFPTPRPGNSLAQQLPANTRFLQAASEHGMTGWFVDHFQFEDRPYFECLAQLAHSAGRFPGLRVGSLVLGQGYRNPALVAKIGATLQALTGGNLILGIGAGWKEDEYLAYGYEFPSTATRIAQLDEACTIIKALWAGGPVTFVGEHYQVHGAHAAPVPNPKPLLMIGGGGEKKTLRLAAKHADWWNVDYIAPELYAKKLGVLRDHCTAIGRDPDSITPTYFALTHVVADSKDALTVVPPNYPPTSHLVSGTPDQVIAKLRVFEQIGAKHIQLAFLDFPKTAGLELFLTDVLPAFSGATAEVVAG